MILRTLAVLLTGLGTLAAQAGGGLAAEDAWVPEAPPVARVMAAYMQLVNGGAQEAVVVGATSSDFGHIEMHRTVERDGVARMVAEPELAVPAGGSVKLERGGLHLMLMEPKRALRAGDTVEIGLQLRDGSTVKAVAAVRAGAPAAGHGEREHHRH
jgi:copper(I)-binding protein